MMAGVAGLTTVLLLIFGIEPRKQKGKKAVHKKEIKNGPTFAKRAAEALLVLTSASHHLFQSLLCLFCWSQHVDVIRA